MPQKNIELLSSTERQVSLTSIEAFLIDEISVPTVVNRHYMTFLKLMFVNPPWLPMSFVSENAHQKPN